MKTSVLIAAFHADPFIASALESVRAQTHADWEIIVVEDGSHDATADIVRRFAATCPQRVVYENLGKNRGVAVARNRLLELAQGEALAFLDADDTWEPGHLAAALAQIAAGADLVVSGVRPFDLVRQRHLESVSPAPALARDPVLTLFQRSAIITSSAVVLRASLARTVGRFDPTLRIGEDRDYWLRCALARGRFRPTKGFTCNYAKHLASSMARTYLVAEQAVRFHEKYLSHTGLPLRLRRRQLAGSLVCLGRLLREHDAHRSAACFWRAWHFAPLNPLIPLQLAFTGCRSMLPQHAL